MQQVSRNRVASQGVVPRLAGRPCEPRHRTKLRVNCSSARADGAQTEAAPEVWSHLSSGQQQLTSTSTSCSRPCSGQQQGSHSSRQWVLPVVAMHQLCMSLHMPAHAAESVSPAAVEVFREFLDQITALGPWGGALFVLTVMTAEMVPLFPTQPLTLASGLLFGPIKGAIFVVVGVTLAAANAFTLARGVGRKLAEKVIAAEMSEGSGPVAQRLAAVNKAIESGGFMQQVTAVTLLRLTPVVPFSASNYLLGLTPVQLAPMLLGTVAGMSVWSILYASLGGASRQLLDGGAELDVLLEDLAEKAGQYSQDVAVCGLALGLVAAGYYMISHRSQEQGQDSSSQHHAPPSLDAPHTPEEVLQQK